MTLAFSDLALYAIAVFILFITPGPVWVALLARAMSGGFQAAWPLALGVAIGDAVWPVLAVLGVSWGSMRLPVLWPSCAMSRLWFSSQWEPC